MKFEQVKELTLYYCEKRIVLTDFYAIHSMFPNLQKLRWFLHHEHAPSPGHVQNWLDYARLGNNSLFLKDLSVELKEWI